MDINVETGISFVAPGSGGDRWHNHKVSVSSDYVESRLEEPALAKFEELPITRQVLLVRAVTELMMCVFRRTRHDPSYDHEEAEKWRQVVTSLLGTEGIDGIGI